MISLSSRITRRSMRSRLLHFTTTVLLVALTVAVPAARGESEEPKPSPGDSGETPAGGDREFAGSITVHAASRRAERLVEAPAAVTAIDEEEITLRSTGGDLAQVLAGTPGVELNDEGSGSYDLNARGLGGDFNRRIAIVVDGRDVATPMSDSYEWILFSNLADLAQVELVRGPASALYGANAYNGVLSVVTRSAAEGGGRARLVAGGPRTARGELSWARRLDDRWSAKVAATAGSSEGFLRSRTESTEYAGLPLEAAAPPRRRVELGQLVLRVDRQIGQAVVTGEAGRSESTGATRVSGAGRMQTVRADRRTWGRVALDSPAGSLSADWTDVRIPERIFLSFGGSVAETSSRWKVEGTRDQPLLGARARLRFGGSFGGTETDSANESGAQTLLAHAASARERALFAQLDVPFASTWRGVVAARWDDSSLYPNRLSPKLAVVWSPDPSQSLRFTAQRAFQAPNYFELFFDLPSFVAFDGGVGPSVDLSPIETEQCAPAGIDCGFSSPIAARERGNAGLDPEEISTLEVGYTRQLGRDGWLQLTYYRSRLKNFITESLPNVFGAVNPSYAPYLPAPGFPDPPALEGALAAALGPLFPFLTRDADGTPLLVTYSVSNAARVDTQGVELGVRRDLGRRWRGELGYTWFFFDLVDRGIGGEIVANAPRHSGSATLTWHDESSELWARWRRVEAFRWAVGGFDGEVPTFDALTLGARRTFGERVALQLEVENALGRRHFEAFGGDLLGRRWNVGLDVRW